MNEIYLEITQSNDELISDNVLWPSLSVTLDTYVASFVLCYCKDIPCKIYIVETKSQQNEKYYAPKELFEKLDAETVYTQNIPPEVQNCALPCLLSPTLKTCVAGLAGVLRFAIKDLLLIKPKHFCNEILGYRGGCLAACSEVSVWTKFCEKDIQAAVRELIFKDNLGSVDIPENLLRFEEHLNLPVKTHNLLKRKQDLFKENKTELIATPDLNGVRKDCDDLRLTHAYFAGIDRTLADFVTLPCIYLILNYLNSSGVKTSDQLPTVCQWYQRMLNDVRLKEATITCKWNDIDFENVVVSNTTVALPEITSSSLYLRDPTRTKVKIKHKEPTSVMDKLKDQNISPIYSSCPSIMDEGLDWHSLPISAHPAGGDLPLSRVDRKCQQVESMVTATMDLARVDDVIVDFCAGGGHVGILLAYYLPKCKIVLIENKESSLQRARDRASVLQLDNLYFYQCNLDHFNGKFNIAVSLHACGVATDLVLNKCLTQRAKFLCCPCCYGSIHEVATISYPRSQAFKNASVSSEEFVSLGHFADRTEADTLCEEQGKFCMGLIDTDRAFYFQDQGYRVSLCTLKPPDCTPKSNLLIGIPLESE